MRSGARTLRQLAEGIGCSARTLRTWRRQDEADRGERDDTLTTEEQVRPGDLEREIKTLREEREILNWAATFFARESDRP